MRIKTIGNEITLASDTEGEQMLLCRIAYSGGLRCKSDATVVRGDDCSITFEPVDLPLKAEPLPTSILNSPRQKLLHILSQQQAAKVASYYTELWAHHLPPELIELLTLEYQRKVIDNA